MRTLDPSSTRSSTPRRHALLRGGVAAVVLVAVCAGLLQSARPAFAGADDVRRWPVPGPVIRAFDPPEQPWLAGHRGIDIAAPAGTPVVASAAGTITWAGSIAGVPMVTVTHADGLRTTYQPVSPVVATGAQVDAGQQIGVLLAGHATQDCLHLGLRRGNQYLDPLAWLGGRTPAADIRLLPEGTQLSPVATSSVLQATTTPGWPVTGPITSAYGWRTDPITGARSFHSGTDIGAACGTPVGAALAGTVVAASFDGSLGNYVVLAHDDGLDTVYGHLSRHLVSAGQRIVARQVLGLVGSTGRSTGCHLHFAATRDGASIDSGPLLP